MISRFPSWKLIRQHAFNLSVVLSADYIITNTTFDYRPPLGTRDLVALKQALEIVLDFELGMYRTDTYDLIAKAHS
jgi:hypothetical protein